jgi:phytoene synthase
MARCDRRAMRPARIMRAYYGELLRQLKATGWQSPRRRVSLGRLARLKLMLSLARR